MNKIFKVVWSKVKHCYVVVSEIAKNTTSGGARRCRMGKVSLAAAMAAAVLTGSFAMPNEVRAATTGQVTQTHYIALATHDADGIEADIPNEIKHGSNYRLCEVIVTDSAGNPIYKNGKEVTRTYYVLNGYDVIVHREEQVVDGPNPVYENVIAEVVKNGDTIPTNNNTLTSAQSIIGPIVDGLSNDKVRTVLGTSLNSIGMSTYSAATNGGIAAKNTWQYIIEDSNSRWVDVNDSGNSAKLVQVTYNSNDKRYHYTTVDSQDNTVDHIVNDEESIYYLSDSNNSTNPYIFLRSDGTMYTGTVRGLHNEILMTAVKNENGSKVMYTYWGAKLNDDETLVSASDITVGDLNKAFRTFESNDKNLAQADIANIKLTQKTNGGTLGLTRGSDDSVLGDVTITSMGGKGEDVKIQFTNTGVKRATQADVNASGGKVNLGDYIADPDNVTTFTVDAGSKVVANKGGGEKLSTISINGTPYTIQGGLSIADLGAGLKKYNEIEANANEKHGWTLTDVSNAGMTFKDTTLVDLADEDIEINKEGTKLRDLTIYDTAGNAVVLEDVASNLELQGVIEDVAINTENITTLTEKVTANANSITSHNTRIQAIEAGYVTDATMSVNGNQENELTITKVNNGTESTIIFSDTRNSSFVGEEVADNQATVTLTDSKGNPLTATITNIAQADDLSALDDRVTTNAEDIATNTSNITKNATDITNLTEKVTANANSITSHNTRIKAIEDGYIKTASVSGSTLTLTNNNNETVTFTDTNNYVTDGSVSYEANSDIGTLTLTGKDLNLVNIEIKNTYTTGASINGNDVQFNRNDSSSYGVNFTAGGGTYNDETKKYEDSYVKISAGNSGVIKLSTGSIVKGHGVATPDGGAKALSEISINGEQFLVPTINGNPGTDEEAPYLTSIKLNDKTYNIVSQGSSTDYSIVGEKNNTTDQYDNAYIVEDDAVKLNRIDNLTQQVEEDAIVINNVASAKELDAEVERATKEEARIEGKVDANTEAIAENKTAIAENKAAIEAEVEERFNNDIKTGAINHESGTITLTRNNGTKFDLSGKLCDSSLDAVSYDAKTGKMTFTIKDHYNQDQEKSIVVEDIASKAALEKEINDRVVADTIEKQERIAGDNMMNSKINQLGSKVNKVGAGAAALAALHPMDFDPDDKLSFSAGVGNYAGQTATALGAFYRPNEKVMMSIGGTYGNNENMVNMGVSFALDRTNNISNSRTAMAREIVDLREQVATQGQQIAQLVALVNQLTGVKEPVAPTVQPFPDVPANHWAYEYLNNLVAMGVIEGYPDGTFGGDRTMTRYEFATMLFKAMQNGAVLSEQIRQEFNAELGRIRVDRIKGADDDANKIERVRVNNYEDRDDYGSKIVMVSAGK